MDKINVSIVGAGLVGLEQAIAIENGTSMELAYIADTPYMRGKTIWDIVEERRINEYIPSLANKIPDSLKQTRVISSRNFQELTKEVDCIFVDSPPTDATSQLIKDLLERGITVISHAYSLKDFEKNEITPFIFASVNLDHVELTKLQKTKGRFIISPNCTNKTVVDTIAALRSNGIEIKQMNVRTDQSLSGGGYGLVVSRMEKKKEILGEAESCTWQLRYRIFADINSENKQIYPWSVKPHFICERNPERIFVHGAKTDFELEEGVTQKDIIAALRNYRGSKQFQKIPSYHPPLIFTENSPRPEDAERNPYSTVLGEIKYDGSRLHVMSWESNTCIGSSYNSNQIAEALFI